MSYYNNQCSVSDLKGKTLASIRGEVGDEEIVFVTTTGETFRLYHSQSCCEQVSVEDIVGDLQDLVGSEILVADEVEGKSPADFDETNYDSYTWTYYKFATFKGYVDIRWFGTSNGYYGEGVDFEKVKNER